MSRLDHGVVGNGHVLALVAPSTRVEWFCLPRFDSPSVFAALLDPAAGHFEIHPESQVVGRTARAGRRPSSGAVA